MTLVTNRRCWMVLVVVACAWPTAAIAGGCEVLRDPRDRAECVARQEARAAARAEVERQVDSATPSVGSVDTAGRSAVWQRAIEQSDGIDASALLEPRPIAAVGGIAWFLLVLRSRRRGRPRARRA